MSFPSLRAIHADVLKGMISYRIWFSECEHGRASNGQHARKRLFTESCPACQEQNSDQNVHPFLARNRVKRSKNRLDRFHSPVASAERYRIRQRLAGEERVEIGDHAVLHRHMRLQRMAADM